MKRSYIRRKPRRHEDKVTPEDYAHVMARDGGCVARQLDINHKCEGRNTLDHVPGKGANALGRRAPSDRWHLLVLCWGANVNGWASAHRDDERAYLARVEPDASG